MSEALIFGDSIADDLRVIRSVVNSFAGMTATKVDDTVVEVIDSILASPGLIALVDGILGGFQKPADVQELNLNPAVLVKVMQYLPIILDLIKTFRNMPKAG